MDTLRTRTNVPRTNDRSEKLFPYLYSRTMDRIDGHSTAIIPNSMPNPKRVGCSELGRICRKERYVYVRRRISSHPVERRESFDRSNSSNAARCGTVQR